MASGSRTPVPSRNARSGWREPGTVVRPVGLTLTVTKAATMARWRSSGTDNEQDRLEKVRQLLRQLGRILAPVRTRPHLFAFVRYGV
jgi:hypothetical protein